MTGRTIGDFYTAAVVERVQNQRLRATPKTTPASSSRPKLIDLTPSPKKRRVARSDSYVALELALNDLWDFQPSSGKKALKESELVQTISALSSDVQEEDAAAYDDLVNWNICGWVAELKEKMATDSEEIQAKTEKKKSKK